MVTISRIPDANPFSRLGLESSTSSRSARRSRTGRIDRFVEVGLPLYHDRHESYQVMVNSSPDPFFMAFLEDKHPKLRAVCAQYGLRPADTDCLYDHLSKYGHPLTPFANSSNPYYVCARQLLREHLPKRGSLRYVPLCEVSFNPDTAPGVYYQNEGFRSKRDAHASALEHARNVLELLKVSPVCTRPLKAGGRPRLMRVDNLPAKRGRMVQAQDLRDFLICSTVTQPFTDFLVQQKSGVFGLGLSHMHGGARSSTLRYLGCSYVVGIDISGMDVSVSENDALDGVEELERAFPTPAQPFFWDFFRSSVLRRSIVMPDGMEFHMDHGAASGHSGTSLLETIILGWHIRAALLSILFERCYSRESAIAIVRSSIIEGLGDDLRMGFFEPEAATLFSPHALSQALSRTFNGKIRPDKVETALYPRGFGLGDSLPTFLGKVYTLNVSGCVHVSRPFEESLAILAWPERGVASAADSYNIGCGLLVDNPHCFEWQSLIREYLSFLEDTFDMPLMVFGSFINDFVFMNWDRSQPAQICRPLEPWELDELYEAEPVADPD